MACPILYYHDQRLFLSLKIIFDLDECAISNLKFIAPEKLHNNGVKKGSDVTIHTEEKYAREHTWLEPFEALGSSQSVGVVGEEFVVVGLTLSESVESCGLAGWGFFGGLPGRPFFFFMGTTESSPWLVES